MSIARIAVETDEADSPLTQNKSAENVNPALKWCTAQKGKRTHEWA